jgi:hypothetical protein
MTSQRPRRLPATANLIAALPTLLLLGFSAGAAYGQQTEKPEGPPPNERPAGQEFSLRGQRAAREIKYSDWSKFCFQGSRNERGVPDDDRGHV